MRKKTILIIEDELELANMIKKYLQREHYDAEIIVNGNDALQAIKKMQPDLVLLDLMLPHLDGLEVLRQIRLECIVPVIIISAKETELDKVLGLKLGADDYMTKPFSMKEMVARVEALFRRIEGYSTKDNNHQTFQFNNINVDLLARQVRNENEVLNFTTKEMDLLTFLLRHPKQALSKEQIYNHVWGLNEYGDINTVTIHIQKIREKLGPFHEITTVRGVGYRFDGELR